MTVLEPRRLVIDDRFPPKEGGRHRYPLRKAFLAPQREHVKQPMPSRKVAK